MEKKKCRHREIEVSPAMVVCTSCGKVWLLHKGNLFHDMSFRAGGEVKV